MVRVTKVAALVSALLSTSALAQNIEGTVLNKNGSAVVGAKVEVEGTNQRTVTNSDGECVSGRYPSSPTNIHPRR